MIQGTTFVPYTSMQEIGMNFQTNPEISDFCTGGIPSAIITNLLNPILEVASVVNTQTLLSPVNYYAFEVLMDKNDYVKIQSDYGMTSA